MAPLEPEVDPWTDTTEERGQERDDPFDNPPSNPFGMSPETIGVPNVVPGAARTGPTHTSRRRFARAVLLGLLLAPVVIRVVAWAFDTLPTWLG